MLTAEMESNLNEFLKCALEVDEINKAVVDRYNSAKSHFLFDLFPDDLIVKKPINIELDDASVAEYLFLETNWRGILDCYLYSSRTKTSQERLRELQKLEWLEQNIVLSEKQNFISPRTQKEVSLDKGVKLSTYVKFLLPKEDESVVVKLQNCISQALGQKKIKGNLCLSIHPLDYLTMSENKEGWTSCFEFDGVHKAAITSFLNSPNTVVAYVESNSNTYVEYFPEAPRWNSKKWRVLVSLDSELRFAHIGNSYPYDSDPLEEELTKMVGELIGEDLQLFKKEKSIGMHVWTPENVYNDAHGSYIGALLPSIEAGKGTKLIRTSDGSTCIKCGRIYTELSESFECPECCGMVWCEDCGMMHQEDTMRFVADTDRLVCNYCLGEYYEFCYSCQEYFYHYGVIGKLMKCKPRSVEMDSHVFELNDYYCPDCFNKLEE